MYEVHTGSSFTFPYSEIKLNKKNLLIILPYLPKKKLLRKSFDAFAIYFRKHKLNLDKENVLGKRCLTV